MPWYQALFFGIFHAVSAFCNAGFDLIGEESFIPLSQSLVLNGIIMTLIVLGGIGFFVWRDVLRKIEYKITPKIKKTYHLSLHSKLVILTTTLLIFIGTVYFFVSEYRNPDTLQNLSTPQKILASLFQSVTLRTAGFFTIPQNGLKESSKLVSSVLMLIGGSPGGTAGGIKTVTLAIVFCSVWSTLKGRNKITVFERTLPVIALQKAVMIIVIMLFLWITGTIILSVTEQASSFAHSSVDLLYEVASALGTVGLTTGITPHLSVWGKVMIALCMFIGRIGPLSIILSLSSHANRVNEKIQYPEERVMIG